MMVFINCSWTALYSFPIYGVGIQV